MRPVDRQCRLFRAVSRPRANGVKCTGRERKHTVAAVARIARPSGVHLPNFRSPEAACREVAPCLPRCESKFSGLNVIAPARQG
jgi:hypothetical protein